MDETIVFRSAGYLIFSYVIILLSARMLFSFSPDPPGRAEKVEAGVLLTAIATTAVFVLTAIGRLPTFLTALSFPIFSYYFFDWINRKQYVQFLLINLCGSLGCAAFILFCGMVLQIFS